MSGELEVNFGSWGKAARVFADDGVASAELLDRVLAETTDPGACNAAEGLAGVDGAVAIMLSVFGEVMRNSLVLELTAGFDLESRALLGTGQIFSDMEDQASQLAAKALGDSQ